MQLFTYDAAVAERFPAVRAAVIRVSGVRNGPSSAPLRDEYRAEQAEVAQRLAETAIADHSSISAWRRAFSAFGAEPTRYRNAAEALLRRLDKQGDIPSINALVDIGNLVSIRYAMPVAVVDLAGISGGITVRIATGEEEFTDLGATEPTHAEPGEVVFADEDGVACARRWCWRQSAQSATGETTVEALFVTEGQHERAAEDVDAAAADLLALLATHQPGCVATSYVLPVSAAASA